jgi:hypothetical protein
MSQARVATIETGYGKESAVSSVAELLQSVADPAVRTITVAHGLEGVPENVGRQFDSARRLQPFNHL